MEIVVALVSFVLTVLAVIALWGAGAAALTRRSANERAQRHACQACGRAPALPVKARAGIGAVIFHYNRSSEGTFCREHGLPVLTRALGQTLATGWWGVASFFLNFWFVASDVFQIARFALLAPPASAPAPAD